MKKTYTLRVDFGDKKPVKSEGETVLEALTSLPKPRKITGKTLLSLTDGKRSAERLFMPTQAKRLFYPLAQQYLAKQLTTLLK